MIIPKQIIIPLDYFKLTVVEKYAFMKCKLRIAHFSQEIKQPIYRCIFPEASMLTDKSDL